MRVFLDYTWKSTAANEQWRSLFANIIDGQAVTASYSLFHLMPKLQ